MTLSTGITGKESSEERKRIAFQLHRALGAMGSLRVILQQAGQDEMCQRLGAIGNEIWGLVEQASKEVSSQEWSEANNAATEPKWDKGMPYTSPWGARKL